MRVRRLAVAAGIATALLAGTARGALASVEEFESFDVVRQERDDESLLDHRLTRPVRTWERDAAGKASGDAPWRSGPNTLASSQGCLTSDRWFLAHDLGLETALGERARFALSLEQRDSDALAYQHLDFAFRFRTRFGWPGVMLRPLAVKARQDYGLTWRAGADTLPLRLDLRFVFEDTFNSLWNFRQTQVGEGGETEKYEIHPYEPGIDLALHRPRWSGRLRAHALTPSRRQLGTFDPELPRTERELWGTFVAAEGQARGERLELQLEGENRQAEGREQPPGAAVESQYRRQWSATAGARWQWRPRLALSLGATYASREQAADLGGVAIGGLVALDRLLEAEVEWRQSRSLRWRAGLLYDRVGVARSGIYATEGYGTRSESRAYVGPVVHFGQVIVAAVEGFELDREPYDVWGVHDKGFVQIQARF